MKTVRLMMVGVVAMMAGVAAAGNTYCVWTNGTPAPPYDNWSNCFTNIQDAVNYASNGDTVLVSNGLYMVTGSVTLNKGVTVQSAKGAAFTTISLQAGVTATVVSVTFSNAVLDGFTIQNGNMAPAGNAGGVYVSNTGMVQNCVIVNNRALNGGGAYVEKNGVVRSCRIYGNLSGYGAGVYLLAGTVAGCTITNNDCTYLNNSSGGGVNMGHAASVLRNCLIKGNKAGRGGGGVSMGNGTLENCTIVENLNLNYYGGGLAQYAGTVRNTVVWNNTEANGWWNSPNWYLAGGTASNCCSPSPLLPSNAGNTAANPRFQDREAGNFRLSPGSPCIDAGMNGAGGATDLDGNNRTDNGVVDMGAYEFTPGALQCSLWTTNQEGATPYLGLATFTNVFVASVAGTNTSGLYYRWDFNSDGAVDLEGANLSTVTNDGANAYTSGVYSVALTVDNNGGESAACVRTNFIRVGPATVYVRMPLGGTPAFPYATWATAATNVIMAVNVAVDGTTVLVTNGVYTSGTQIFIPRNVTLKSVNGKEATTLYGSAGNAVVGTGYVALGNVNGPSSTDGDTGPGGATIQGFAINAASGPGGAHLFGGTITDCMITNIPGSVNPNVVLCVAAGGRADRCTVVNNYSTRGVSGIFIYTPVALPALTSIVDRCVVMNNRQVYQNSVGNGSYWMSSPGVSMGGNPSYAILRNSLIMNNYSGTNYANVECWGGVIENCTIVGNTNIASSADIPNAVGGLYVTNNNAATPAIVRNCILWGNTNITTGLGDNYRRDAGTIQYTCTTPDAGAYGSGNIVSDPVFIGPSANNYRLEKRSPCIGAGTNVLSWMTGALDLDGTARIKGQTVDMGAYESAPVIGTLLLVH